MIVKGILAMNLPVTPEMKKSGTNTATVVMVPAMSGQAYSRIEARAASTGSW